MTSFKGWFIGLGIFGYFAVTTVWLPSKIITGPLGASSRAVQDVITMSLWAFFLILGMWTLRVAQRRGLI